MGPRSAPFAVASVPKTPTMRPSNSPASTPAHCRRKRKWCPGRDLNPGRYLERVTCLTGLHYRGPCERAAEPGLKVSSLLRLQHGLGRELDVRGLDRLPPGVLGELGRL